MKCDSEILDAKEGSRNSSADFKGITVIGNVEKKFIQKNTSDELQQKLMSFTLASLQRNIWE